MKFLKIASEQKIFSTEGIKKEGGGGGKEGVSRKFPVFLSYQYSIEENLTNCTSVKKTIRVNYFSAAQVNAFLVCINCKKFFRWTFVLICHFN